MRKVFPHIPKKIYAVYIGQDKFGPLNRVDLAVAVTSLKEARRQKKLMHSYGNRRVTIVYFYRDCLSPRI